MKKKGAGSDGGVGIVTAMVQQMKVLVMFRTILQDLTDWNIRIATKLSFQLIIMEKKLPRLTMI